MENNISTKKGMPDLTACEKEPIHILNAVQPHGVLMVLDTTDFKIIQISENVEEVLGYAPSYLLGSRVSSLFSEMQLLEMRSWFDENEFDVTDPLFKVSNPLKLSMDSNGHELLFDGILHRYNDNLILELEPISVQSYLHYSDFYQITKNSVRAIQKGETITELCQITANEVRKFTGFDRVMVYRFDEDWNGVVMAESKVEGLESYLNVHFPASDIPPQARRLYTKNWIRLISTIDYKPAKLTPELNPISNQPLDMSYSVLRSVSPVHLEYLGNMGVHASMSISIMKEGKLWGLIACHHGSPKFLPYEVRTACEFYGQIFSSKVSLRLKKLFKRKQSSLEMFRLKLSAFSKGQASFTKALSLLDESLLKYTNSEGVVFCLENEDVKMGKVPEQADLELIKKWLVNQFDKSILYSTHELPNELPEAIHFKDKACGILATTMSLKSNIFIIWFRPEVVQSKFWGGNPTKVFENLSDSAAYRISPRKSFEKFQQEVQNTAQRWKKIEVDLAMHFQILFSEVYFKQSLTIEKINDAILHENRSSIAGQEKHKNIESFAEVLERSYGAHIEDIGKEYISFIINNAKQLSSVVEGLLEYTNVGNTIVSFVPTNLNNIVQSIVNALEIDIFSANAKIEIPQELPHIKGDPLQLRQIFHNLFHNALENKKEEVPLSVVVEARDIGHAYQISVTDNGVGIDEIYHKEIFELFKRVDSKDKKSGIGLSVCKKIVAEHGGEIWIESKKGVGTTVFFTLKK